MVYHKGCGGTLGSYEGHLVPGTLLESRHFKNNKGETPDLHTVAEAQCSKCREVVLGFDRWETKEESCDF